MLPEAVTVSHAAANAVLRVLYALALSRRKAVLSFDQHGSIGDKSGEYGGRYGTVAPRLSIASTIPETL
jgi:hypothetical protein